MKLLRTILGLMSGIALVGALVPAFAFAGYDYSGAHMLCTPSNQTAYLGQEVTFTAQNSDGPYTWATADRVFVDGGQVFKTTLDRVGMQTVKVSRGGDSADCSVNVVSNVNITSTYVPALPNTGFEPQSAAAIAFALVALLGLGVAFLPYVRKVITAILG